MDKTSTRFRDDRADAETTEEGSGEPVRSLDCLEGEIAELAAQLHAATYRLLVLIAEFDRREGWGWGFRTCGHWLSWRTGIALGAAREKVRVARALQQLPRMSEAMRRGELSYSKCRALTRVATAENEEKLMDFARAGTASHVETMVRAWRRVDRLEEEAAESERHRSRRLQLFPDEDGSYLLRGRLDPEVGAVLMRALESAAKSLHAEGEAGAIRDDGPERTTPDQRWADAIGLVAESALQSNTGATTDGAPVSGSRADRFQVFLHVSPQTLEDHPDSDTERNGAKAPPEGNQLRSSLRETESRAQPRSNLQDGVRVSAETSRRLACDCDMVKMHHAEDGSVLDVGRKTRTVPPATRRALDHRDQGCRFPGCGLRFCDAHHIRHWADGGATDLNNLVLLCRRHHRAVHEERFQVELGSAGEARFFRPDGRSIPDAPTTRYSADPLAAMRYRSTEEGVTIDEETGIPEWFGETFDLDLTIQVLRAS